MKNSLTRRTAQALAAFAAAWMLVGCEYMAEGLRKLNLPVRTKAETESEFRQQIPAPVNLLLPSKIRIHPFTGTRTFDESGGVRGIDVRIEAIDAFGDPQKAFGDFRFELYSFEPFSLDPKGGRIASWHESLIDPKKNLVHWDGIAKRYQFKLQWNEAIPVGQKFVLVATFSSPFTERLFDQRVFVSGQ